MDFNAFAAMGGYAGYVWPAYGLALVCYGAIFVHALKKLHRLQKQGPKK
jgi:heme exporter protein D